MSEVPIGAIEFLVKFDDVNQEFKDAMKEAVQGVELGTGGARLDDKLDEISNRLKRMYVPLGKDVSYFDFVKNLENQMEYFSSEENIEKMVESLLGEKRGALRERLGVKDAPQEQVREAIDKYVRMMFSSFMKELQTAEKVPSYYSKMASTFGKIQAGLRMGQGSNWLFPILDAVTSALISETLISKGLMEPLERRGMYYAGGESGGEGEYRVGGEKAYPVIWKRVGEREEEEKFITSPEELSKAIQDVAEEMGEEVTPEELVDVFMKKEDEISAEIYDKFYNIIEELVKTYELEQQRGYPRPIVKMLETMFGEKLSVTRIAGSYEPQEEGWFKKPRAERIKDINEELKKIPSDIRESVAADVLFLVKNVEDLQKIVEDLKKTGATGVEEQFKGMMELLKEGKPIIGTVEAKTREGPKKIELGEMSALIRYLHDPKTAGASGIITEDIPDVEEMRKRWEQSRLTKDDLEVILKQYSEDLLSTYSELQGDELKEFLQDMIDSLADKVDGD